MANAAKQAKTQKARGLQAISEAFSSPFASVPSFDVLTASDAQPEALVGKFCRPCPTVPRHGFVDSRRVNSVADAKKLIAETLAAEPQAEIITMQEIPATHNAIWSDGLFVVGPGNDGATSGKQTVTLPALGSLTNEKLNGLAGISDSPYMEFVFNGSAFLVQLRNGPKVEAVADYIPAEVKVERVILAEGDLLEWESVIREAKPGTVVYHPSGSLASHYSVHAVARQIAVLTSREPKVGETLKPAANVPTPNVEELTAGFLLGATADISYKNASRMMLLGCHHAALWSGRADRALGFAMGCAWRLSVCAALGERRHVQKGKEKLLSRDQVYQRAWGKTLEVSFRHKFRGALNDFLKGSAIWSHSFGGAKWYESCLFAMKMWNAICAKDYAGALQNMNALVHAAHNGGWLFNKFLAVAEFNSAAVNPAPFFLPVAPMLYGMARAKCVPECNMYKHPLPRKPFGKKWQEKLPQFAAKKQKTVEVTDAQAKLGENSLHIQYKVKSQPQQPAYYKADFPVPESDKLHAELAQSDANRTSYAGSSTKYFALKLTAKGWVIPGTKTVVLQKQSQVWM